MLFHDKVVSSYFDIGLVVICLAFWFLFIHSSLKLLHHCFKYGRQRGIVSILTTIYILTLIIIGSMTAFLIFHEVEIHPPFHRQDNIANIVRIIGSYLVLWLNFSIDCLILSCWFALFADLFGYTNNAFIINHGRKKIIYATFILSAIYFLLVLVASILIEIADITIIDLSILSYIHFLPIIINIIVSLLCVCKLPIAQV